MAYCIHCGAALKTGVNFCSKCGAEVQSEVPCAADKTDEVLDDDEESEVEDCDEEPEKGAPSDCYATFEGRTVSIYRENGSIYRRIHLNYEVLGTQVSGDNVAITCEGGRAYIYTLDGTLIRQMRY